MVAVGAAEVPIVVIRKNSIVALPALASWAK
jgi:hypothetical protein